MAEGVHRQKASQVATISGGQADMLPWSSNSTVCQRREAENLFSLWSNSVTNSARGLSAYTYPIRRSQYSIEWWNLSNTNPRGLSAPTGPRTKVRAFRSCAFLTPESVSHLLKRDIIQDKRCRNPSGSVSQQDSPRSWMPSHSLQFSSKRLRCSLLYDPNLLCCGQQTLGLAWDCY